MSTGPKSYAGFWKRVRAFVLDYFLILFYLIVVTLTFLLLNPLIVLSQWLFMDRVGSQIFGFLLVTLPVILYFAIGESSVRQATWGKYCLGLRVTDAHGARIGFWRALLRSSLKFVPWELSHTLLWEIYFSQGPPPQAITYGYVLVYVLIGLNIAGLGMTRKRQTIYDFISGTRVIS